MDCRPGCGRQLFGQKSEKRLELDDGAQLHLLAGLGVERPPPRDDGPTETDERRAKVRDAKVAESRLRFGADVPAQTIEVTDPVIEAIPASRARGHRREGELSACAAAGQLQWNDLLQQSKSIGGVQDFVRRHQLVRAHELTKRNVIVYSGWLQKGHVAGMEINDEDKNGFMTAVHQMDRSLGLDLLFAYTRW